MYSNQEDPDTNIDLRDKHADDIFQQHGVECRIIIKSPDTEIIVKPPVHFFSQFVQMREIFFFHACSITSITYCQ